MCLYKALNVSYFNGKSDSSSSKEGKSEGGDVLLMSSMSSSDSCREARLRRVEGVGRLFQPVELISLHIYFILSR